MTTPLPLPNYQLVQCTFTLQEPVASVASHGGTKLNLTQVSDPVWTLAVTTRSLRDEERRAWTVWKNQLRGGLRGFTAYDVTRKPLAYPAAQSSTDIASGWDGTANVASVGLSGALGLSGLPANYQIKAGDRIGLESAEGHIGYHEANEDQTASAAGEVTVSVSPLLYASLFTTGDTARLWLPVAKFIIDWQSWQEDTRGGPTPISFKAYQRVMQ